MSATHPGKYFAAVLGLMWTVVPSSSYAQYSPISTQTPPEKVADAIWQRIVTVCPVPGSASKSAFYLNETLSRRPTLYEYRDPWTRTVGRGLDDLTTAEKLNGLQWTGAIALGAQAYRMMDSDSTPHRWSEWSEMAGGPDAAANLLAHGQFTSGVVVLMQKKNNQWTFSFPGAFGLLEGKSFNPDDLAAKKVSCETANSPNPFLKEETQRQADRDRQLADARMNGTRRGTFGMTLVCQGTTMWIPRRDAGFMQSVRANQDYLARLTSITEKGGELQNQVEIQVQNSSYIVEIGDLRDRCPGDRISYDGPLKTANGPLITARSLIEKISVENGGAPSVGTAPVQQRRTAGSPTSGIDAREFNTMLWNGFVKRSQEVGVDANSYRAVVKEISDLVMQCTSLDEVRFATMRAVNGVLQGSYVACNRRYLKRVADEPAVPKGILLNTDMDHNWDERTKSWNGPRLHVDVAFEPPEPRTAANKSGIYGLQGGGGQARFDMTKYGVLSVDVK